MSERLATCSGGLGPARGREAPCTPDPKLTRAGEPNQEPTRLHACSSSNEGVWPCPELFHRLHVLHKLIEGDPGSLSKTTRFVFLTVSFIPMQRRKDVAWIHILSATIPSRGSGDLTASRLHCPPRQGSRP